MIATAPVLEPASALNTMTPQLTALRCLFLLAMHHGCQLTADQISSAQSSNSDKAIARALRGAGFRSRTLRAQSWDQLVALGTAYPVLAMQTTGHWVIVAGPLSDHEREQVAILDPARERLGIVLVQKSTFIENWSGLLLLCKKAPTDRAKSFGLGWFVAELLRHGTWLRHVAIAAVASNLISLATPLLYHVIIDKVIPNRASNTLLTVVVIFLAVTAFDSMFVYLRQRLMLFITNKMDASLGSRVFARLLQLPMPYFEHMAAGVLARHMQQTEKLRHFLTGRLFQTTLDCATLPVLLVLLASYSLLLSAIVFGFAISMAGVIAILVPSFRTCLNQLYAVEADRQAQLVETIHGIRTIKSLAMESVRQTSWNAMLASSVRRHAVVGRISAAGNVAIQALDKLMQISVLGLGAQAVFAGHLSIGALVAFTMLAARVSGPLMQIVGLINEYQETLLSTRMLAAVMDHPPERPPGGHALRPLIEGGLSFEDVTFCYSGAVSAALDQVSFRIEPGEVVGVVGRSGSGKTTLIRLIQGIQSAQAGLIRVGATDIRLIDLAHLRRNVGVVLQDSFLFRGTIRDNIAAANPSAPLADIIAAARMAGADEFVDRLPLAYETAIEEGAVNFSGGQRQRISIARALLTQPRLLIFDEATSALDPESEAILQANLRSIAAGRTMILVSHRLASLVRADRILVLDRGRVVDFAPHDVLTRRCDVYRSLWQQQTQHMLAS